MLPAGAARKAVTRPFVIAIGGGAQVREGFRGRVLNIAHMSTVYGDTATLLDDEKEIERLARWPVAVALHDVWRLDGDPLLIEDLGMPDRRVLEGAVDGIVRHDKRIAMLWEKTADWPINLATLPPPANFVDTGVSTLRRGGDRGEIVGGIASEEGRRIWALQLNIERDRGKGNEAKRLSAARHGRPTCEACGFGHDDVGMLDEHHLNPLASGIRQTLAEHLIILCPTCHRRAHRKDKLAPYTLAEVREWVSQGCP